MKDPMKPCSQHKPHLAWLALDTLEAARAEKLRAHLELCPGCRQYWADICALSRDHQRAAEALPDARAGEAFHRHLDRRIQAEAARPGLLRTFDRLWRGVDPMNLRFASAVAAVLVAALVMIWTSRPRPTARPADLAVTAALPHQTQSVALPPPTLLAYRVAPNRSPDALDDLVARQAAGSSFGAEALTIYAFRPADLDP